MRTVQTRAAARHSLLLDDPRPCCSHAPTASVPLHSLHCGMNNKIFNKRITSLPCFLPHPGCNSGVLPPPAGSRTRPNHTHPVFASAWLGRSPWWAPRWGAGGGTAAQWIKQQLAVKRNPLETNSWRPNTQHGETDSKTASWPLNLLRD